MERIVLFSRCVHPSIIRITHIRIQDQRRDVSYDVLNASSLGRNFTKLTQKLRFIMFHIIAKFQENLSTQFVLKCKSGKNFADFTIFSCVSSYVSTFAHRNFTKLTQKLCLIMFYIIAKFQENLSTQFVFKCKSGKNLAKIFQVALVQGQIIIWINIDQY